jgi:hypothetical protein
MYIHIYVTNLFYSFQIDSSPPLIVKVEDVRMEEPAKVIGDVEMNNNVDPGGNGAVDANGSHEHVAT